MSASAGSPTQFAPITPGSEGTWLWNRRFDAAVVACGAFFLLGAASLWLPLGKGLNAAFASLTILINYPHYAATYQVIVRERKLRPGSFAQLLWSSPLMAALILVPTLKMSWMDLVFAPVSRLYMTWSIHHYAAQHFGVAAMYSARASRPFEETEKRWLQAAFLLIGLFAMLRTNTLLPGTDLSAYAASVTRPGIDVPVAGIPAWSFLAQFAALAASAGAIAAAEFLRRRRTGGGLGSLTWLLYAANSAWFAAPNLTRGGMAAWPAGLLLYMALAPQFFHCAQYLAVTTHRSRMSGAVKPVFLAAALIAGGWLLFQGLDFLLPRLFPVYAFFGGLRYRALLHVVAVVNLHHFWMDGLIWKRKRALASVPASS